MPSISANLHLPLVRALAPVFALLALPAWAADPAELPTITVRPQGEGTAPLRG